MLLSLLPCGCLAKDGLAIHPVSPLFFCQRALAPGLLQCGDSPFQHLNSQ